MFPHRRCSPNRTNGRSIGVNPGGSFISPIKGARTHGNGWISAVRAGPRSHAIRVTAVPKAHEASISPRPRFINRH